LEDTRPPTAGIMASAASTLDEQYKKYKDKLDEVTNLSVNKQAKVFLKAFVLEFKGSFQQVLDCASDFSKYAHHERKAAADNVVDLDEVQAHLFLEHRGETLTVKAMRDKLAVIDIDHDGMISFVEYALFNWKHTLDELFAPPTGVPPEVMAAFEKAVAEYEAVLAKKKEREDKMSGLEQTGSSTGVKAMKAKAELAQMKSEDRLAHNKAEVTTEAQKRKMERAINDGDAALKLREEAHRQEEAKLAEENRKKAEEARRKQEESRQRLAAKAAMWNNK